MKFLYTNRRTEDKIVIGKICFDILSQELDDKEYSEEFCGIWIDGRSRTIDCIEDLASIYSFYLYSERKYPMLVFCNNKDKFLEGLDIRNFPIEIIQIPEINTHDGYSEFCKFKLPFLIPDKYQKLLFLQADAFLIKKGWEIYVNSLNTDYIGAAWLHYPTIEFYKSGEWCQHLYLKPSRVGNGGFSYRTLSNMRSIAEQYENMTLRERGTLNKPPAEDLFFSSLTQLTGSLSIPEEAVLFSSDPLTWEEYQNKSVFGGHFPVYKDRFKENLIKEYSKNHAAKIIKYE